MMHTHPESASLSADESAPVADHATVFDEIYRSDMWLGGSGGGSREEATRDYRKFLENFLRMNRVRSVVDLGCGDWQFSRHIDWSGISYTGVDVSNVVLETTREFAREGVTFIQANAIRDPLPPADLLLVKDVLQHLSNADVQTFMSILPNFKMALITNGFSPALLNRVNDDIQAGGWRPVDLSAAPFHLPGRYVYEFQADEPKRVFLWMREPERSALSR